MGFPSGSAVKNSPVIQETRRLGLDPWMGKNPWRRNWQTTPVVLPRKSHGQRSLVGYSPWSCKESDTTETTWHACKIYCIYVKVKVKITQSCSTLSNSMDYTVHGILQARILEWLAIPFSRKPSWPRDQTLVSRRSCTGRQIFFFNTKPPVHLRFIQCCMSIISQ